MLSQDLQCGVMPNAKPDPQAEISSSSQSCFFQVPAVAKKEPLAGEPRSWESMAPAGDGNWSGQATTVSIPCCIRYEPNKKIATAGSTEAERKREDEFFHDDSSVACNSNHSIDAGNELLTTVTAGFDSSAACNLNHSSDTGNDLLTTVTNILISEALRDSAFKYAPDYDCAITAADAQRVEQETCKPPGLIGPKLEDNFHGTQDRNRNSGSSSSGPGGPGGEGGL